LSSAILVIAFFWMIDGRLNSRYFLSALLAFLIVAEACNALILHMTLLSLAAGVFGVGGLIASESRREGITKICWALAVVGGLAAIGIPAYRYAIGSNTAFRFFFDELNDFTLKAIPTNANLKDDFFYILQWRFGHGGIVSAIVSTISIVAASYISWFGRQRRMRVFAGSFLALVFGTAVVAFAAHFWFYFSGQDYRGPNPYPMVHVFWPFHIILLALVIRNALAWLVRLAAGRQPSRMTIRYVSVHGALAMALALPAVGVVVLKDAGYLDLTTKPNEITNYLGAK